MVNSFVVENIIIPGGLRGEPLGEDPLEEDGGTKTGPYYEEVKKVKQ